jgi:glycosyltransferase involved in cell wall biosynthesis
MLLGRRVAVVVPARDEARWIEETLATMPALVDCIVVVDDGSSDDTAERVQRHRSPRVHLLRQAPSRGVGAAIYRGYAHAAELGAFAIAVMAGDGQMHPDDLPAVLEPVLRGEADYVKGDRVGHPSALRVMPLGRLVGSTALAWLTRMVTGLPALSDAQCGFTAVAAAALPALCLEARWPGYGYPNDLLGAVARAGLRMREVTVRPVYRGEASGLGPRHLATFARVFGRLVRERLRDPRPQRSAP